MAGTVADRNNNPGNLRDPKTGTFRVFKSPQEGFTALLNDLQSKIDGKTVTGLSATSTLHDFASKYAPSGDNNNVPQYTVNLANTLGVNPDTPLGDLQAHLPDFAQAIAKNEGFTAAQGFKASIGQPAQSAPSNPFGVATALASTGAPQQSGSGPVFPFNPGDNPLTAGLKAVGNLPGSAVNFGEGVLKSANPLSALENVGNIGTGAADLASQEGTGKALWDVIKGLPKAAYETLIPQGVRSLLSGDTQGAAQSFTNDPFGQAAPLVLGAEGVANLADKATASMQTATNVARSMVMPDYQVTPPAFAGAFDRAVSGVGGAVTDTLTKPISAVGSALGNAVLPAISHLTSLPADILTQVLKNPDFLKTLQNEALNRPSVAEDFGNAIDSFIADKQSHGAEYQAIHDMPGTVQMPEGFIEGVLNKLGLEIEPAKTEIVNKGKEVTRRVGPGVELVSPDRVGVKTKTTPAQVIEPTTSKTRVSSTDLNTIQKFYDVWGDKTELTPNEFLNFRHDINVKLKSFEDGKTSASKTVGQAIYDEANKAMRPQIPGLKALDEIVSPQLNLFKTIKKEFLDKEGDLKPGAANKLVKTFKTNPKLLAELEKVSPGIGKNLELLDAKEQLEKAMGTSGHNVRNLFELGSFLKGSFPEMLAAIILHPKIALQITRGFGIIGSKLAPVVSTLDLLTRGAKAQIGPALKVAVANSAPNTNRALGK